MVILTNTNSTHILFTFFFGFGLGLGEVLLFKLLIKRMACHSFEWQELGLDFSPSNLHQFLSSFVPGDSTALNSMVTF